MCRHRTASATIAQLMVAVFVSLHRDSESAKNHFPSWRKIFLQLEKWKKASGGKPGLLVLTFKNRIAYETEHESIHQVSHRGRVLCHRHLPHQLVYRGTRDWEEPEAAAGE